VALAGILLDSVQQFAAGAPQEDDITVVLVKREAGASASRSFIRSFDAIQDIFAFTAAVFAREQVDPELLPSVDLTLEELFTNMVKYSVSSAEVRIDMTPVEGGVEVTLTDYDVEPFDVTQAPDVDINLPIEQRKPGGLGLHLIRRLVDRIEYEYSGESRQSRITFRKTQQGARVPDGGTKSGSANAGD
jgi:serine/threonine-protein kinase RsbW